MNYTSPSPANIAINGNYTTWWIPATNLSSLVATGVIVNVSVSPANGLILETWSADQGTFNVTTGIWQVGTLQPGQTKWLKIITKVSNIGLAPFTLTSVISGNNIDPNNLNNTKTQTITSVVTSTTAGANDSLNKCACIDVSSNDVACNYGVTEWRLDVGSITNSTSYTWDETTGQGSFTHVNPTLPITFTYTIWCDPGTGFVEISGPASASIRPILEDINVFDHTIETKLWGALTPTQQTFIETLYPGIEWVKFGWSILLNGEGEITSALQVDINEKQNTKFIPLCSDTACTSVPSPCVSCPQGSLPNDVLVQVEAITDYVPQEGDSVFVNHTDGFTVHTFKDGTWVQWPCGCVVLNGEVSPCAPINLEVVPRNSDVGSVYTLHISGIDNLSPLWDTWEWQTADKYSVGNIINPAPVWSAAQTGGGTYTQVGDDLIIRVVLTSGDCVYYSNESGYVEPQANVDMNIQHAACSPASGAGTLADPLVVDIPVADHVFPNAALNPGDPGTVVDVGILFSTPCADGCTPTYTLGGFSSLVYENITLVGATLSYNVKADAPSGNYPIVINRDCA